MGRREKREKGKLYRIVLRHDEVESHVPKPLEQTGTESQKMNNAPRMHGRHYIVAPLWWF